MLIKWFYLGLGLRYAVASRLSFSSICLFVLQYRRQHGKVVFAFSVYLYARIMMVSNRVLTVVDLTTRGVMYIRN